MYGLALGAVPPVTAYGGRGSMHSGRVYWRCMSPHRKRQVRPPSSEPNMPAARCSSGTSASRPTRPKPVDAYSVVDWRGSATITCTSESPPGGTVDAIGRTGQQPAVGLAEHLHVTAREVCRRGGRSGLGDEDALSRTDD